MALSIHSVRYDNNEQRLSLWNMTVQSIKSDEISCIWRAVICDHLVLYNQLWIQNTAQNLLDCPEIRYFRSFSEDNLLTLHIIQCHWEDNVTELRNLDIKSRFDLNDNIVRKLPRATTNVQKNESYVGLYKSYVGLYNSYVGDKIS